MKLSVVIPVYYSEETIVPLVEKLFDTLMAYQLEIVLVNDGSKDQSEQLCRQMARQSPNVKFISLRKNSGEHNAVMCGLSYCTGDYVAIIDDDLQNPPSEIVKLVEKARVTQADVVYARYDDKRHSFYRNLGSKLNDLMATYLLNKPQSLYLASFKVINISLVKEILKYNGPFPYLDSLILRITDNIQSELVAHHDRAAGKSRYTLKKLLSLPFNTAINYSNKLLRIVLSFGFIFSLASYAIIIFVCYERLFEEITWGWVTLAILFLFLIIIFFTTLLIVGEYIGKILMNINKYPQYVVKEEHNTTSSEGRE